MLKPALTYLVSLIKVINHLLSPAQVSGVVYEETAGRCVRDPHAHTLTMSLHARNRRVKSKALITKETVLLSNYVSVTVIVW